MKRLGIDIDEKDLIPMGEQIPKDEKSDCITLDDIYSIHSNISPIMSDQQYVTAFKELSKGLSEITMDTLKTTLRNLGENIRDDEVKDMLEFAKGRDGKVTQESFISIMKQLKNISD